MKAIVPLIIIVLTIISCKQEETTFSLIGKTNNIENGIMLYLENSLTKEVIDSAIVENNSFEFHTTLPDTPLLILLFTKDYSHYRNMWLEDKPMTFDASISDFSKAEINGSISQQLLQGFINSIDTLPRNKWSKMEKDFITKNPNSIVSANMLSVYSTSWGRKLTTDLFNNFSEENKSSIYGKMISKYLEVNINPQIGDKYVDFEMEDLNGKIRKLSDIRDKVILLEFWASNCYPCRVENPSLVKTYQKYHAQGFEIFAVSQDVKRENWLKAIEKDGLPWIHVSDLEGMGNLACLIYGVNGIPDNFLIDKNGVIIGRDLRGEELNKKLDEMIQIPNNISIN